MEWLNPFNWNSITWGNVGIGLLTGIIAGLVTGYITGNMVTRKYTKKEHKRETLSVLSNAFWNLITLDIYLSTYQKESQSNVMRDRIENHFVSTRC